ncbi:hypothetical protein HU200_009147 [Digitaria exilis]|uniref:glutathione transferase n=1 Tax=Digitaria exilis TaxID=1010633 RepID=A0A835FKD1_9POAL|nr:hypothetical protein HU200_009147 [Digitaria exilis]CAB3502469.1 unnamed protein product [Digitaria exilis]
MSEDDDGFVSPSSTPLGPFMCPGDRGRLWTGQEIRVRRISTSAGGDESTTRRTHQPASLTPSLPSSSLDCRCRVTYGVVAMASATTTKVYGWAMSPFVSRALLCLEEAGVAYELVPMSQAAGDHRIPDYLARNPFGQVPVLEDGGITVFGSLERSAMVDVWLEVEAHQLHPVMAAIAMECLFTASLGRARDQAVVDENVEKLKKVLEVYESRLSRSRYLAGDFVSLADLSHFTLIHYFMATEYAALVEAQPHVRAWWEELAARPAARKVAAFMPLDFAAAKKDESLGLVISVTTSTFLETSLLYSQLEAIMESGVVKVYGPAVSPYVATVLVCLEEAGVAYEVVPLDMAAREQKAPHHLARNLVALPPSCQQPFGTIPALEDGDLTLFESRAISRYVLRKYGSNAGAADLLREGNLKEASMVDTWLEVEAHQYHPACVILPMIGGARDQRVVDEHAGRLGEVLRVYDAVLGERDYLAGDFVSLADVAHFGFTHYLMGTEYAALVEERPNVRAWWERLSARPAVRKVAALMSTVAVAVLAVVSATASRAAEATIESTCSAAATQDRRVDVAFCSRQFAAYHGAAEEAGPWGLARTAALVGVNLADDAAYDIGEGTIRAPPASGERGKAAMDECARAYDAVGMAFAEAADELGARRYAAAEERFARVAALARRCDGDLAVAGVRTPPELARYSAECQQMAVIGIAITNLIT